MLIVGERINCTRKRIGRAVEQQDADFIKKEAIKQVEAGAEMLDVNGGIAGGEEDYLPWLVSVVQEVTDLPLSLDSPNPEALRRALPLCRRNPMINSITAEPGRLEAILPLVTEYDAKVIALCIDSSGIPQERTDRVEIAFGLIDQLTMAGVPPGNIYVDLCVFPIGTGQDQGTPFLEALGDLTSEFPEVHSICGVSNVSFGLPMRKLLNSVFLTIAMSRGLDSAIVDPCDRQLMSSVYTAETLLGRDEYCSSYLKAYREGRLDNESAAKNGGGVLTSP